jgi:hypothetical protein
MCPYTQLAFLYLTFFSLFLILLISSGKQILKKCDDKLEGCILPPGAPWLGVPPPAFSVPSHNSLNPSY